MQVLFFLFFQSLSNTKYTLDSNAMSFFLESTNHHIFHFQKGTVSKDLTYVPHRLFVIKPSSETTDHTFELETYGVWKHSSTNYYEPMICDSAYAINGLRSFEMTTNEAMKNVCVSQVTNYNLLFNSNPLNFTHYVNDKETPIYFQVTRWPNSRTFNQSNYTVEPDKNFGVKFVFPNLEKGAKLVFAFEKVKKGDSCIMERAVFYDTLGNDLGVSPELNFKTNCDQPKDPEEPKKSIWPAILGAIGGIVFIIVLVIVIKFCCCTGPTWKEAYNEAKKNYPSASSSSSGYKPPSNPLADGVYKDPCFNTANNL